MLVLEYSPHGPLLGYLQSGRGNFAEADRLQMAIDCARGLAFLASCNFVHGDVSGSWCETCDARELPTFTLNTRALRIGQSFADEAFVRPQCPANAPCSRSLPLR